MQCYFWLLVGDLTFFSRSCLQARVAAEASRQIISIEINYQVPNLPNLGLQSIRVHCHFDSSGGRVFELYIIVVLNGLHYVEYPKFRGILVKLKFKKFAFKGYRGCQNASVKQRQAI